MENILKNKRLLKKTGIEISEYGFGAWGIGGIHYGAVEEEEAQKVVLGYISAGGNYIDTARGYGDSEKLIGKILKENLVSKNVVISTKTKGGEHFEKLSDIRRDLEKSLTNLQRDHVDIFFLHFPPENPEVLDLALEECEKLKAENLIKAIGVSVKGPDVTQATQELARVYIKDGRVDVIMMVYSIFRQMNYPVFREAHENDIGIIVRTVMESGFLSGALKVGTRYPDIDHRSRWNDRVDFISDTVEKMASEVVVPPYEGINEVAIRFAAGAEGVTSVLTGALELSHLEANLKAIRRPPLDPKVYSLLREKYKNYNDLCNSGQGSKIFFRPDGVK